MVNSVSNSSNSNSISKNEQNSVTVKSGDTLSSIAQRNGVSVSDMMKANPQLKNPNTIMAGQALTMPEGARKTGSLSGLMVAQSANPAERPAKMTGALSMDVIAAKSTDGIAATKSLPAPYNQYAKEISAASQKYNIPPEIIAGVISRETNGRNIIGDGGHGHGLMQIDDRFHGSFLRSHQNGLDPASNIDYGTSLLRNNLDHFNGDYRKALAAYNAGIGGVERAVRNGRSPDSATTGGDYSADVLRRAEGFKGGFSGGSTIASSAPARRETPMSSSSPSSPAVRARTMNNSGGMQGSRSAYTVVSGDTLSEIAQRNGMSLRSIIAANPQIKNPDLIFPGQKINMGGGSGAATRARMGGGVNQAGGTSAANSMPTSATVSGSEAVNIARSVKGRNIADLKYNGPLAANLDKWPGNNVCCANFVSAVLEKSGQISHSQHNDSVKGLAANLRNDPQWRETSLSNAKPGDVVAFNVPGEGPMSHVVMFAGWNNGRPSFIGSNNANSDGSQRITEGYMGYPVGAVFHYNG